MFPGPSPGEIFPALPVGLSRTHVTPDLAVARMSSPLPQRCPLASTYYIRYYITTLPSSDVDFDTDSQATDRRQSTSVRKADEIMQSFRAFRVRYMFNKPLLSTCRV